MTMGNGEAELSRDESLRQRPGGHRSTSAVPPLAPIGVPAAVDRHADRHVEHLPGSHRVDRGEQIKPRLRLRGATLSMGRVAQQQHQGRQEDQAGKTSLSWEHNFSLATEDSAGRPAPHPVAGRALSPSVRSRDYTIERLWRLVFPALENELIISWSGRTMQKYRGEEPDINQCPGPDRGMRGYAGYWLTADER